MTGWFRRRPLVVGGALAVLCGLIAAVAVIFFVEGDEPADVPISCSVHDSEESVLLTAEDTVTEKEAEDGCSELAAELSGSNAYWIVGMPLPPEGEPELTCALVGPEDEGGRVIVEENPEAFVSDATGICGGLVHEGWTQDESVSRGPWQREYDAEMLARELVEEEEREEREAEAEAMEAEAEAVEAEEEAIYACQEKAEAAEEAELEAIEREMEERIAAGASFSEEIAIEEESWAEEEEAWERGEAAFEACER